MYECIEPIEIRGCEGINGISYKKTPLFQIWRKQVVVFLRHFPGLRSERQNKDFGKVFAQQADFFAPAGRPTRFPSFLCTSTIVLSPQTCPKQAKSKGKKT